MSKKFIITENERREIRKLYRLSEDYSLTDAEKSIAAKFWGLDKPDDEDVTTDVPSESGKTDSEEVEKSSGDTQDVRIENGKVKITGDFKSEQLSNINFLIDEMNKAGITDPYAQVGILSVIKKESGFIPKSEVSYSKTSNERLRKLFGKRLRKYSESELDELKKDDRQFYNVIYAKTVGNQGGDDGYNYRGRGFNQLTGIKNYEKYGNLIGMGNQLVENPDLVNDPKIAAKIALKFFTKGKSPLEFPKFKTKEEAAIKFADINAGGGVSSHRDSALKASGNFEVVA
jgi:predicted chitinase